MVPQNYVSYELTHFVGASIRAQHKQYSLFKKILKSGVLKASPRLRGSSNEFYVFETVPDLPLSSNESFRVPIVCFCDIPVGQLALHMKKYGKFGIAFDKDSLARQGASPVIYVPREGIPALLPYEGYSLRGVASQRVAWDQFGKLINRLEERLEDLKGDARMKRTARDLGRVIGLHTDQRARKCKILRSPTRRR